MSTPDTAHKRNRTWVTPLTGLAIGLGYLVAGLIGDNTGFGVFGLCLMIFVVAGFWLLSRRSETFAGLLNRRDERINAIDTSASAFAGLVVLLAVLAAFMVEIARGRDGMPYAWLGAIGGLAYVAGLIWGRFRR